MIHWVGWRKEPGTNSFILRSHGPTIRMKQILKESIFARESFIGLLSFGGFNKGQNKNSLYKKKKKKNSNRNICIVVYTIQDMKIFT